MAEEQVLSIDIEGKTLHLKVQTHKESGLKEAALVFNTMLLDLKAYHPRLSKEERLILSALNLLSREKQNHKEAKKALETSRTRLQEALVHIQQLEKELALSAEESALDELIKRLQAMLK
mgnify:FL=1